MRPLVLASLVLAGCAQIQDLGALEKVDCLEDCAGAAVSAGTTAPPGPEASGAGSPAAGPPRAEPSAPAISSPVAPDGSTWSFRRDVTLTSDEAGPLGATSVLVVLAPGVQATAEDLRFRRGGATEPDLAFFVERLDPSGPSFVWVRLPSVAPGASTIAMFYGNARAPAASDFAATFPNAVRTAGGGAGSFTAKGDIDVDWFELRAGDTLTLASGAPLRIRARRVILAGNVDGNGRGQAGGPGAGAASNPANTEASGGGGYGGSGGRGGEDVAGAGGIGGAPQGTKDGDDLGLGAGGGATSFHAGGAGGGALAVLGWRTTASGIVSVNGTSGGGGSDRNAGGGSGGGLLFGGARLELGSATLTANGGAGGACTSAAHDGGGGGGGGRIKIRRRAEGAYEPPAAMTVLPGPGGGGAGTTAPGVDGSIGTIDVASASALVKGVSATVGEERAN